MSLNGVYLDVVILNQQIIFSSIVLFLEFSKNMLKHGFVRIQWIPSLLWIILLSLLTLQVALILAVLFCKLYGFAPFGCYGVK